MMIVTSHSLIKEGIVESVFAASQKHVAYSRTEPDCISHGVFQDPENPLHLFFMSNGQIRPPLMPTLLYPALNVLLPK